MYRYICVYIYIYIDVQKALGIGFTRFGVSLVWGGFTGSGLRAEGPLFRDLTRLCLYRSIQRIS